MTDQQLTLAIPVPPGGARRRPPEPIIRAAVVEDNYRWTATRAWGAGPRILWCGNNPSDANAKRDDPSIWRMMGFSYRWGFGSMVVINVYPFVAASMTALRTWCRDWRRDVQSDLPWEIDKSALNAWRHNQDVARAQIREATVCVAAWGNLPDGEDLSEFLEEATGDYNGPDFEFRPFVDFEWKCIGKTAGGAPKHPLARGLHRVPDDAVLIDWRKQ